MCVLETSYSWQYVVGYIFVGVAVTSFGALVIASVRGGRKKLKSRRERDKLQQQLLERLEESVKVFEPIQDLIVYLTKEQLKQETSYYADRGIIPLHHKTELISFCDKLHKLPNTNGDVTEIKNRLLELETEEVG